MSMKIFVPFDETLFNSLGEGDLEELGALVPFQLDYPCARLRFESPVSQESSEENMGWLEVVVG